MKLEPLKKKYLDQILEIENESFSIPWSRNSFEKELDNKLAVYVVCVDDDENVLGYGGMWHVVTEGYITNIAVSSKHRRNGIGDKIVKELIRIGKEKEMIGVTLEVRVSNDAAISLYKKNGFKLSGRRKEYYENKEDAYIMWNYFIPESEIIG